MNAPERQQRGPPYGAAPRQDQRMPSDPRNGSGRGTPVPGGQSQAEMTKAQMFEDEKRRIVESCFAKKDPDGSQIESYITHIRITEDAAHPSLPPPPTSDPDNKKPRVIIVAVRKSGRVRLHKARENSTGSFSIGKTWNLDELNAIQSYTGSGPTDARARQEKQWASNTGFIVTLGKPYYWQAVTAKEKDFFIASLTKIYRKYTGGKLPELIGFDPVEQEQLIGAPMGTPGQQVRSAPTRPQGTVPPPAPSAQAIRPQSPHVGRAPSRDGDRAPSREGFRPSSRDKYRPPSRENMHAPNGDASRPPMRKPSQEQMARKQPSSEQMQRPGPYPAARPRQHFTPQSSQSSLPLEPRGLAPMNRPGVNGASPTPPPQNDLALRRLAGGPSTESLPSNVSRELLMQQNKTLEPGRNTPDSLRVKLTAPEPVPEQKPEKARLPVLGPTVIQQSMLPPVGQQTTRPDGNDAFFTPTETPARAPSRASEHSSSSIRNLNDVPPIPGYFPDASSQEAKANDANMDTLSIRSGRSDKSGQVPLPTASTPISTPASETPAEEKEGHRPGLGPMIKKKSRGDVANAFRKAALAANAVSAFKPRAGGAAERLMADKDKSATNEPDGITGVVPAPLLRGASSNSARSQTPDLAFRDGAMSPGLRQDRPLTPALKPAPPEVKLQRTATDEVLKQQAEQPRQEARTASPDKARSRSPGRRRRQLQEGRIAKYCSALGIDPKVLEGRGGDFDDTLTELGWEGKLIDEKKIEDIEADVRREIGRAQASGWLGHLEQQEGKIEQLGKLFDKVIDECEELDGLMILYSHELNTLADDVAFIEAQSQGLQVQTANQKLLQTELQNLMKTITISSSDLQELKEVSLGGPDGIQAAERLLLLLYKAMLTIDPDIRQNKQREADAKGDRNRIGVYADTEIGQMRAVRDKKEGYREETQTFLRRLDSYMQTAFDSAGQRTRQSLQSLQTKSIKLDPKVHDGARHDLWMYNALLLFVREVNVSEWQRLIGQYKATMRDTYQDEFRDNIMAWKILTRKSTGEEQEILFTGQEKDKEPEGITSAARKLTVKRGRTVRVTGSLRQSVNDKLDGKVDPFEAFAGALGEQTKLVAEEQNFAVQFFHLSSLSNIDFADAIAVTPPDHRKLPNLSTKLTYDPDREMATTVERMMEDTYSGWPTDLQTLVDWATKPDQLQGVGVMYAIERTLSDYEESNQEFITQTLRKLHERLTSSFHRFIDEQVHGIEETKVKIKKRKGVIAFMRVFPSFSAVVENMLPTSPEAHESLEVRFTVNDAYTKINKAMWECLSFIAKENPGSSQGGATANISSDPEDKEALNYHILLIENMNHYIEEVETHDNIVLEEWREKANHDMYHHLRQYSDAVIRRPLGKLLEFVESTESALNNVERSTDLASKASHSRSTAKKTLGAYDASSVKKGVEVLKKRVEKHFGDADEPGLSRSLVVKVLGECTSRYADAHDRTQRIIDTVYEGNLDLEWRKEEVAALFRR